MVGRTGFRGGQETVDSRDRPRPKGTRLTEVDRNEQEWE